MTLALSALSQLAVVAAQAAGPLQGTLTISLNDTSGLKVAPGSLSIKSSQGAVVYSAMTDGPTVVHIPYGRYSVEFENTWSPRVSRQIVIDRPDSFVELAPTFVPE